MEEADSVQRLVTLAHENGLHLTPITRLVQEISEFSSDVTLSFDDKDANAKSAVELMLLGATQGAELRVTASGSDADAAIAAAERILGQPFDAAE